MKVAISFPGCHRRGGVERVMVECLNFLAQRDHETHAFASQWDPSVLRPEVIRHDVPSRAFLPAMQVNRFRRASAEAIMKLRPSVVGSFGVAAVPGSVVWMQSVHAAWMEISRRTRTPRERFKQRLNPFHPMILHAERQMLDRRNYRRLIALTPQVREDLHRYYGVPAADVDLLPNGFSRAEFNPDNRRRDRAEMRRRLDLPDHAKVVVFVANESERKGLPQLLRAAAKLGDSTLHILAVGRFDPAPVRKLASSVGLGTRLRLPGASAQVAQYYAAADLFALPTQYEAWGLVIVEALACGLPVLTSRLAGAAVTVRAKDTVTLLDRLDGLDPEVISRSVAAYEWSRVLEQYERILLDCGSGATPSPITPRVTKIDALEACRP